ncbi:MAG: hypothetical protein U9N40_03520 [Euryarchaeota archaeon]|nr:hypothetical protein [Euryarchaeota archaeon]
MTGETGCRDLRVAEVYFKKGTVAEATQSNGSSVLETFLKVFLQHIGELNPHI